MVQDVVGVAAGVLEGVREDRYRAEVPRLVHRLREGRRGGRAPRRVERDGAKGVGADEFEGERALKEAAKNNHSGREESHERP